MNGNFHGMCVIYVYVGAGEYAHVCSCAVEIIVIV